MMKAKTRVFFFAWAIIAVLGIFPFLTVDSSVCASEKCVIKMGYRTNKREPLIGKYPDNSGLYFELYSEAAEKIGCDLNVVREPKKRILRKLEQGEIDFYPGFNFTQARAKYVYYFENGLPGGDVGLSLDNRAEITDLKQLIANNMRLLGAVGGPEFIEGVKESRVNELDLERVAILLKKKRADFYIYNKSTLEYFLMKNELKGFKIHPRCCGGIKPLYLGFSLKSEKFERLKNPDYAPHEPLTAENLPFLADPESLAAKFAKALMEMKASGKIAKLYEKFYEYPMK